MRKNDMTNLTYGLLLKQFANRLRNEVEALDKDLPKGVKRELEWYWIGKGPKPAIASPIATPKNFEQRPTGRAVMLRTMEDIIKEMEEAADEFHAMGMGREETPEE